MNLDYDGRANQAENTGISTPVVSSFLAGVQAPANREAGIIWRVGKGIIGIMILPVSLRAIQRKRGWAR